MREAVRFNRQGFGVGVPVAHSQTRKISRGHVLTDPTGPYRHKHIVRMPVQQGGFPVQPVGDVAKKVLIKDRHVEGLVPAPDPRTGLPQLNLHDRVGPGMPGTQS
ncbi:hypothetical protein [Arthrobacter sp. ISL-65]|uniref:hypothetical protein n=1 Tax=Arthrobacter sp. ISL-65 TaxID=2819112 RepID=UPI001BE6C67E|nr:hypothetical protein [Arthrobacter sp. ISL-65]MBT2548973.1 hypothetical protein [Arthrobacter sp. ISL-65]